MNKLFSQFLNPPKMISIILILVVLFIIYYFGPGIIKSLYEVGYQTGNAISSWVKWVNKINSNQANLNFPPERTSPK